MPLNSLLKRRLPGLGRVRSFLRGPYPITLVHTKTIDGLSLALDPESFLDYFVIENGYYEREILDVVISYLDSNGVFWDVGANFGLHSLTVKKLRPDVNVFAFEPVPFMAARILINSEINKTDVNIVAVALGDTSGYSKIAVKIKGNSGLSSFNPWPNVLYDGASICRVERGDVLVTNDAVASPTVIKIDVEGYEPQVIQGLSNLLKNDRLRAVIFESDGAHFEKIKNMFSQQGFKITPILPKNTKESSHATPNYCASRQN